MRKVGGALVVVAALSIARAASASPEEDAAAAYDVGAAAYDRGDYAAAAKELARADAIAPNDVALELALHAVLRTDDAVLAMTLADRASARASKSALVAAGTSARARFEAAVGQVVVRCPADVECSATLDELKLATGASTFVLVGRHKLAIRTAARTEQLEIAIEPRKTVEIVAARPADPTPPPPPAPSRTPEARPAQPFKVAPAWFFAGLGLTALTGAATVASGVDTMNKHNAFAADRSNAELAEDGRAADRRTTVLLIVTSSAAVVTGVVGLFLVRWSDHEPRATRGSGRGRAVVRGGALVF